MQKYRGKHYFEILEVFNVDYDLSKVNTKYVKEKTKEVQRAIDKLSDSYLISQVSKEIREIEEAEEVREFLEALIQESYGHLRYFYEGMLQIKDDWTLLRIFSTNISYCWTEYVESDNSLEFRKKNTVMWF